MADDPQPGEFGDPFGDDPSKDDDPFGRDASDDAAVGKAAFGLPAMGGFDLSQLDLSQLMRMLASPGPVNWEIAAEIAGYVALDGKDAEPPLTDSAREELQELARAAESHVEAETGLTAAVGIPVRVLSRREWADLHLATLKPVLEALATTMRETLNQSDGEPLPPQSAHPASGLPFGGADPFGGMLTMLAPLLLGVQAGSMVGYLAQHALGLYDLPLPTTEPASVAFVVPNLDEFESAWSVDRRDLRFYVALHEAVHAAVRSHRWIAERLVAIAVEYVSAYEIDPQAFEAQFGEIDPSDPASLAGIAEHPEALLGAMQSERQRMILDRVQALTIVLDGYADVILERIGERLLPDFGQIHEAMQRHHVEQGEAGRFVEGLLGLRLDRVHYERGQAFCRGVIERAGVEGLNRLWESERMLPTPNELAAPGLWLARIDLPDPD